MEAQTHNSTQEVLDLLRSGFNEILRNSLNKEDHTESFRFYTGKVVNNNDPDKEGKCRVRVYGIHSNEIPDADLPWALQDKKFTGSTKGSFIVPPVDSIVRIYFDNNDIYSPVYTSKILDNKSKFISGVDEDYPDTMVFFETDSGEYFKINRKTGTTTYKHASGLMVIVDIDGNLTVDTSSRLGTIIVKSGGNMILESGADLRLKATTNLILESDGLIKFGGDSAAIPINNVPTCYVTQAPHGTNPRILVAQS